MGDSPQEGAELGLRVWAGKKLETLESFVGKRRPKGTRRGIARKGMGKGGHMGVELSKAFGSFSQIPLLSCYSPDGEEEGWRTSVHCP